MYGIYCTGKVICLSTFVSHLRERGGGTEGKEKYLAEINTFSSGVSRGFNCPSLPNKSKWNKSLVTTKTNKKPPPEQACRWWATYKPAFSAVSAKASAIAGKAAKWQSGYIRVSHFQMMVLSRKTLEMVNKTRKSLMRGWNCSVWIRCFSLTRGHCSMLLCSLICHN